jgi:hypothetical protein
VVALKLPEKKSSLDTPIHATTCEIKFITSPILKTHHELTGTLQMRQAVAEIVPILHLHATEIA